MSGIFVLASNNPKKAAELRAILSGAGIQVRTLAEQDIVSEPEENGTTFRENALIKARAAREKCGLPVIADDSGLEVCALGGAPGVLSARYGASEAGTDGERTALLLRELEGVPEGERGARFVCAAACVLADGTVIEAEGSVEGVILTEGRGENGFGYDPVFYLPGYGRTMAEVGAEINNTISHRARAFGELKKKLESYLC